MARRFRHQTCLGAAAVLASLLALPAARAQSSVGGGAAATARAGGSGPAWAERRAWHMGTWLRVRLAAPSRDAGFAAAERAFEAVEEVEARWSSWREGSETSRLNEAEPGTSVHLSPEFLAVLAELRRWERRTGGAFDPAVGALVDAWDLRGEGRRPGPADLREARRATGLEHLRLDTVAGTAGRREAGMWLDAGAFGKGLALRRARRRLEGAGADAALLDFGGQLVAWGDGPEGDRCWRVAIADPRERRRAEIPFRLCDSSASTSAGSERFVVVEGRTRSHVLDPRTGRPAPAWGSVTVVHPDPMVADLLSTALFVMGPEKGLSWARGHGLAALFLRPEEGGLRRSATPAMEELMGPGAGDPADARPASGSSP